MHVQLNPLGNMGLLSQLEVDQLRSSVSSSLYQLYRNCSLAVLNVGSHTDDAEAIYNQYQDFQIQVLRRERGIKLDLTSPPEHAFVDGTIIRGIQEHLTVVLRDILFTNTRLGNLLDSTSTEQTTHVVFDILRNADAIKPTSDPNLITCWGGHSINNREYKYTKEVGYQLGLRHFNICTGCGPGAMKGPMKGATFGHAKQRHQNGRYIGLTEPSIIAAEPPNPIVNELVIMPDIEKRLEAFVRMTHGLVIFPGGAGTAEELLYIIGLMLNPRNSHQRLPIVLSGPKESAQYFYDIDQFIGETLGPEAQNLYTIIIDDPEAVAKHLKEEVEHVIQLRKATGDAYHFNWSLVIDEEFQQPFEPTHENMEKLALDPSLPPAQLAANLRKAFSGIVAGNVKYDGLQAIKENGPFKLHGDAKLMAMMDKLLSSFVEQQRMKLPGSTYVPCYEIVK